MAHQSIFVPRHPEKYVGNVHAIFCRSGWERRFARYCDETPGILHWSSEEFFIPYIKPTDGQWHKYFPDFQLEVRTANGGVQTFVVEIKPRDQSVMPARRRKTRKYLTEMSVVAVNHAKWKAADAFCRERGWTFLVLNEQHLFGKTRT